MIGALADWFAVVALFRHPMGIPIPHTAIVQRKKDRIGARLGHFVRVNFLSAEVLRAQMVKHGVVPKAMEWLTQKENREKVSHFIGGQAIRIAQKSDSSAFCQKVSKALCQRLATHPVERGAGRWMEEAMHGAEFRQVVAPIFGKLAVGIDDQREWVEQEAGQRAPLSRSKILSRLTKGVTKAFSGHVVNQVSDQLKEASIDQEHPLYEKLEQSLRELAVELQADGENSEWANWREKILRSERMEESVAALLLQAGEMVFTEKAALLHELQDGLGQVATRVLAHPEELQRWEEEIGQLVGKVADQYGSAFEKLIHTRVQEWDATALSDSIERSVGADLQYIRINGSLIGGFIGLALHGIGLLIWGG